MREVSCRAPRMLLEVLSNARVELAPLLAGLEVTLDELRDPTQRIDWDLFATLCDRVEGACEGSLTLEEIGARMLVVPSFDFLRRAGQLLLTPRQLYVVAERLVAPALFPNVTVSHDWLPSGRLVVTSELAPGYRESAAFFRLCHGNVVELPRLLDLPPFTIEEQSVSGRRGRLVLVPPRSHTIPARLTRGARFFWALGEAYGNVARQQRELEASLEALRLSRRELRQLLERLPEGVLIHRGGVVRWANVTMLALLGYRSVDEVVGKPILDFLPPEERAAVAAQVAKAAPNQVNEERLEYPMLRADGTRRILEAGTTQLVEFEGAPARLVVLRDVTEHHRLQEQLALSDRLASIGTVAAGVAHEINNPLAYVHTNLEVASRELAVFGEPARTARLEQCVASALEGTGRVRGIVRNLKTLSRADGEELQAVDLPSLLDSTLVLAASALAPRARVVRSYGPVPKALATQGRLGQVFLNLLINAADALPDGRGTQHEVRVSTSVDRAGRAVVEIADTGVGIPREVAGRVFDPFFTTKAVGAGTGLGLSICHRLVTQLGGEITFSSVPGAGTTFRVALPPSPLEEAAPSRRAPAPEPRTRGRVLVVDDEPALLRSVCRLLGDEHEVVAASSGRQALDVLRDDRGFDAVLADLMMAHLSGMELYDAVRVSHPGLERRIVFMTGGVFTAQGREFLAQVPNRCIEKPFATEELFAALGDFLDH